MDKIREARDSFPPPGPWRAVVGLVVIVSANLLGSADLAAKAEELAGELGAMGLDLAAGTILGAPVATVLAVVSAAAAILLL